jgi:hypothetical protein
MAYEKDRKNMRVINQKRMKMRCEIMGIEYKKYYETVYKQ